MLDESLWHREQCFGTWVVGENAGGCTNNRETYGTNPQFLLTVTEEPLDVSVHPDGMQLGVAMHNRIALYHISRDELLPWRDVPLRHHGGVLAYSHGGHLLAASSGASIVVLDAASLARLAVLHRHLAPVTSLCWAADDAAFEASRPCVQQWRRAEEPASWDVTTYRTDQAHPCTPMPGPLHDSACHSLLNMSFASRSPARGRCFGFRKVPDQLLERPPSYPFRHRKPMQPMRRVICRELIARARVLARAHMKDWTASVNEPPMSAARASTTTRHHAATIWSTSDGATMFLRPHTTHDPHS